MRAACLATNPATHSGRRDSPEREGAVPNKPRSDEQTKIVIQQQPGPFQIGCGLVLLFWGLFILYLWVV